MNGEGPGGVCPFPKGYECKQTLVISHLCGASNEFKKFLLKRFHLLQLVLRFLSVFLNTASVNSDLKILNRPIYTLPIVNSKKLLELRDYSADDLFPQRKRVFSL